MDGDRESSPALAVELLFKRGDGFRHARERERDSEGGLRVASGAIAELTDEVVRAHLSV
jgi:hypothetical protein